ncbi:MAG: choice-of-anchor tandem repeat GloVer-containing protein, partial [Bacteroidia bacterium]
MKKVLLITGLLTILFFTTNSSAQVEELWGSSQYGGDSIGNIFKINTDGSGSGIVHNFEFYSGSNPLENDLLQINGKFYGTTFDGGNTGCGMIFSFDTLSHTYTSVYEFTAPYGKFPSGLLVKGAGSLFYGVCHGGGSYGMGTLYSFDISSNTITILHNFDMTSTGGGPQGLVLASDGKLYGSTLRGGVSDQGVLYSYDIGSNTFTLLMVFNSTQGYDPYGYLVEANNKIFGYTKGDHPPQDEDGRIFCWNILTSSFSLICTFSNPTLEGQGSCEGMMKASDGKIYGTVRLGGANNNGIIFSIDPVTNTYTNEHDFTASEGYMDYMNHFVEGTPGLLYGQSLYGGTSGTGFYYTYQISTHTLTNIYSMAASAIDGSVVSGYNKFGNKLYTVYKSGGIDNIGTITCTNLSTGIQTKYFDFQNFAEGRRPQTALIKGANNKIYGTTYIGGINGYGTIFSIDLCTKSYTRIFDFDYSPNGRYPVGKLVQANNGKLYGLTQTGAASGFGCLYSVDTATNTFTRLYDFATGNLQMPSSLVYNPNDNKVYGVAMSNATSNPVMFSWNVATSTFTTLVGFAVTGTTTYDDFFKMGPGNKMYCFTETGGTSGGGSIGVYDPIANTYTTLHSFAGDDPKGTPCISPSGIIYGNTFIGGVGGGTIFSYNIGTSTYTTLYTFPASSTLGNQPKGGLYLSASGKLYGTSSQGPFGSIFQFDPATNTYTNLHNFNGHDGADPWMELISVGSAPVVTTSSPIVCPGSSITLTASGGTSYLWEPGGMTGASVTTTISSTTTYSVTITEAGGCTNEGGITVGVMQANAGPDQYLCASGGTAQLVASPSGINMSIFNTLNWVHTYGSSGNDNGPPAVVTDPAGNIYTVGSYSGTITLGTFTLVSSGLSDVYLAKMNSAGTVLWAVTSTSVNTSNDYGTSIKLDNAGNIYICGDGRATAFSGAAAPSYYGGTEDAFAAKFNNSGVCQWITAVGGTSADYAYGIDVDKNSGAVYLTGSYASTGTFGTFSSTATSFDDYYLVKFNGSTGAVTWLKTISGGSGYEYGDDLVIDNSGNIYAIGQGGGASMNFGGYTYTSFGSSDFFIVKYNSAGTVQWVTSAGGSNYATPGGIAMDYNKSIYVTGSFNGTATFGPYSFTSQSGTDDFFAAKYNSAGAIQWIKTGTGPGNDEGMDVAVSPTGSTVLFSTNVGNNCNFGPGYLCTFPSASYSTCLISTDTLGNYQWMYNNFSNNIVSYANFDNTGSYIYGGGSFSGTGNVGSTTITPVGGQDALYYKLGLASPITY